MHKLDILRIGGHKSTASYEANKARKNTHFLPGFSFAHRQKAVDFS